MNWELVIFRLILRTNLRLVNLKRDFSDFGGSEISNQTDRIGRRLKLQYLFFQNVSWIVWYIKRKPMRSFFSKASNFFFIRADSHICIGSKLSIASAIFVRQMLPPKSKKSLFRFTSLICSLQEILVIFPSLFRDLCDMLDANRLSILNHMIWLIIHLEWF
jgi:hypothetical protein